MSRVTIGIVLFGVICLVFWFAGIGTDDTNNGVGPNE